MNKIKSFIFLSTLIFTVGLFSCDKEFIDVEHEGIPTPSVDDEFDEIFAEYIDDYSNIKYKWTSKNDTSIFLSGLKNEHLWFSEYDLSTKKLKNSWEDTEKTDSILGVYNDNGEYIEWKMEFVDFSYYKKTKTGDIVSFNLDAIPLIIFTSNDKSKRFRINKNSNFRLFREWYDESMLIGDTCYSREGDPMFAIGIKDPYYFSNGNITPISYTEGINFKYLFPEVIFERSNIKDGETVWKTYQRLEELEHAWSAEADYTILDKSNDNWQYKVDGHFMGTDYSYVFTVNINDGKVDIAEKGVKVTGVTLNSSHVTLSIGETFQLVDTIKPNNVENNKVVWTSSNQSVAIVDQNGLVTAKANGDADITVTTEDGGFTATSKITVKEKGISDYIVAETVGSVINIGGYIQCSIGNKIINNSQEEVQLKSFTITDENGVVHCDKEYYGTLKPNSYYQQDVYIRGIFNELNMKWTYTYLGKEYECASIYKTNIEL